MRLSEVVAKVIRLGEASQAYWDAELPRHHPDYPFVREGEESPPAPPEDAEIESLLTGLPEDQLYAVLFLTYLGRGDFGLDHLPNAIRVARARFPAKELAIGQVVAKPVAEYLIDAMEKTLKHGIDVDDLESIGRVAAH